MKEGPYIEGSPEASEAQLRHALEASGQRFTEQRAAVYRYLVATDTHPTADEVLFAVRRELPTISLATVYKSLETLVGCGLAVKLTYTDDSSRYDGRTDPHHHARCLGCGRVNDLPGQLPKREIEALGKRASNFTVVGYRFEVSGYCAACVPEGGPAPLDA
jgi:Fur family transcriptional regulator, peroxide stress response regulator